MRLRYKTVNADRQAIKKFLSTAISLNEEQRKTMAEKQASLEKWMAEHKQHAMTTVLDVAEAADMLDFYSREYAWQSKPTHSDIEDVVNTHVTEKDGKIKLVAVVASHALVPELAVQLVTMLMETAVVLVNMFGLELPQEEVERQSEIAGLVDELFQRAAAK